MTETEINAEDAQNWYSEDAATFGDRLAAAREAAGLGQKEMAERIGVKFGTYRNWEDDASEPRANRLTMLAGMLGVSMRWLMTGEGEGPDLEPEGTVSVDVQAILAEMRELRVQMQRSSVRLGQLEKRLRKTLQSEA